MASPRDKFIDDVLAAEKYPGYTDDPADTGGETLAGVSRRWNPDWIGWARVEAAKRRASFVRLDRAALARLRDLLAADKKMFQLVREFYGRKYWDALSGDSLYEIDPPICLELLDASVNHSARTAAKFLQRALNIMNRQQKTWPDIEVDGHVGRQTISVLLRAIGSSGAADVLRFVVLIRASRYIRIVERKESQERFVRGWLNRLHIRIKPRAEA